MSQTKFYEGELAASVPAKPADANEGKVNTWTTRLILVTLQVIIAISIFQVIRDVILPRGGAASFNIYLAIMGCTLATICAYLILMKYQTLIQKFSQENVQLGERLGARTAELEKANAEMRLEISERRRVEQALLESEARFRNVIREAAIGIALIDKTGRVIECNPALQAMLGYANEELRGMEFNRIHHPDNVGLSREIFQQLLDGQQEVYRVETRYIRKDGWVGWGRQSISLVREAGGEAQFVIAMFEDITERRENEEKIRTYQEQLQSLASELSLTEERERRRLATVLHDHIAQLLVLAKAKFEKMQESNLFRTLVKPVEDVRKLIEESIRYTRSLIFELSPPILYDLGFEATMEWLAEHMEEQYGLKVEVVDDDQPKPLDNEGRVLLFRAVRELLFNVLKHAEAASARVSMRRDGDQLKVVVQDNGVGFAPNKLSPASGKVEGFGLFSIRERLNYFGGSLEIDSTPGLGARVILVMPLQSGTKTKKSHMNTPAAIEAAAPPRPAGLSPLRPSKTETTPPIVMN
ncbi:MAG: PAS domain S-box protein [Syntrophobacterales bacterium]|jgi:PAS domain S-box-containing protein|nr:PAS domain S-box protein [Syntrophobacterales bacterium]